MMCFGKWVDGLLRMVKDAVKGWNYDLVLLKNGL